MVFSQMLIYMFWAGESSGQVETGLRRKAADTANHSCVSEQSKEHEWRLRKRRNEELFIRLLTILLESFFSAKNSCVFPRPTI